VIGNAVLVLFAYGSLKRGQANHRELRGARFSGVTHTAPAFALRVSAGYPALVPGKRAIAGELYELSTQTLLELDEFEGPAYVRAEIEIEGGGTAITYLARDPLAGTVLAVSEWPVPSRAR
jgi:gamma-glutamylcyclotransferase (GGCT)/AIG2-like uncharacterized protein YtfP